jgi:hypothetical protein
MEHLFIGKEDYYGFLRSRPEVPSGQVWVFQRYNKSPLAIWAKEEEGTTPPLAPLLRRRMMQIYKFRRRLAFPLTISLFEGLPLSVRLRLLITLNLIDPVSFMEASGQFEVDFRRFIEPAILAAIYSAFTFERQKRLGSQVIPVALHELELPIFLELFPDADLSKYIQDHPAFRNLGVKVQVIVSESMLPLSYKKIVSIMSTELKEELLEVKRQIVEVEEKSATVEEPLAFRQRLYTSIVDYYEAMGPRIESTLQTVLIRAERRKLDELDPTLAGAIFKDLVGQQIDGLTHGPLHSGKVTTTASQQTQPSRSPENTRALHIEALYNASKDEGWLLSPDRNKVDEVILIDAGKNIKIELQVPQGYPKDRPVVKARLYNAPIRQGDVNQIVQPITSRSAYDLIWIVKAVSESLLPSIEEAPIVKPTRQV